VTVGGTPLTAVTADRATGAWTVTVGADAAPIHSAFPASLP